MSEAVTASATLPQPTDVKAAVDASLAEFFERRIAAAQSLDPSYVHLWTTMQHLSGSGGKRIRPYLTSLVYSAYSNHESFENVLPVATAQELLHLAMLIHDDIIDRDTLRYGTPNISGSYDEHYETLIPKAEERRHFSDSAALLAGDLLISDAYLMISQATGVTAEQRLAAQDLLHQAIFHVVGGELLDTEASFKKLASAHPITIAEHKTASYSFITPLLIGAALADVSREEQLLLKQLGYCLGVGYQIRDDVLGSFGDESLTGKSTEGDLREGKRTTVTDEFLRLATEQQKAVFQDAFGNGAASSETIATLKTIIKESGAVDAIEQSIAQYEADANDIIEQLSADDTTKQAFRQLVRRCLYREK